MIHTSQFFPSFLVKLPVWVLWRIEERNGRSTKVPYSANYDGRASSTDSETWSTFERAQEKLEKNRPQYAGLGIMMSKVYRLVFTDIDHCIDDAGEMSDTARDIVGTLSSQYCEISQSGSGLHIIALGEIPKSFKNSGNGVEMYSEKRFCAMTGNALRANEPNEAGDSLLSVWRKYKTPEKPKVERAPVPSSAVVTASDDWIISKAKNHGVFAALYSGNWEPFYSSHSEADIALCTSLAFWTDADEERIDRIFRSSGLMREKWEREDYRVRTIASACGNVGETLSSFIERKRREEVDAIAKAVCIQ